MRSLGLPSPRELVLNEMKEGKLTKVLPEAGLPSLHSGQAHKGSRPHRKSKFKRGLKKTPFEFWLPGQDSNLQPSG
jgi:hypothetical protein